MFKLKKVMTALFITAIIISGMAYAGRRIQNPANHNTPSTYNQRRCTYCNGRGETNCTWCNGTGRKKCYSCNGTGVTLRQEYDFNRKCFRTVRVTCSSCNGVGMPDCTFCSGTGRQRCSSCGGNGYTANPTKPHDPKDTDCTCCTQSE